MRMAKRQTAATFCIVVLFCASVVGVCQDGMHVPATHGTTLAGSETNFPDALKAKVNIIVVGFSHASQEQIANWGRLIAADYGKSSDINYFELAMLAGAPKMLRGMIIKRMGASVPFDERDHYIPVLEGEPAWRAVAHYDKPDDAYVLLVDNKGIVLWQTEGEPTNATYANFKQELEKRVHAATAQ
jgi:hypothetical protein